MKFSGIGGQAVLEGIMMRNKNKYCIAVRKEDGTIASKTEHTVPFSATHKWGKTPFIRGTVSLVESLSVGMKTIMWSSEPDKKEDEKELSKGENIGTVLLAVVLALGIFVALPMVISSFLQKIPFFCEREWLVKIIEGVLRLLIFIGYVLLTSLLKDIRRTYMYHGSEHKCINCLEHGLPLTVDNVMKSSKEHRRCGTSFLLIVMLISILLFMLVPLPKITLASAGLSTVVTKLAGFGIRILLIPVVAGIAFEVLQFTGKHDNLFTRIISRPGMWMQALTTKEPTPDMVEVAIVAVENVFDWRAFLRENFPGVEIPEPEKVTMDADAETQEAEGNCEAETGAFGCGCSEESTEKED